MLFYFRLRTMTTIDAKVCIASQLRVHSLVMKIAHPGKHYIILYYTAVIHLTNPLHSYTLP